MSRENPIVAILAGPTASGKSQIALRWARTHPNLEIISADSLLVYRELQIGTAKPSDVELKEVPHHLVNVCSVQDTFTVGDFYRKAQQSLESIASRGNRAVIVGGSHFYLKALLFGLWSAPPSDAELRKTLEGLSTHVLFRELIEKDPDAAQKIGSRDRYRLVRALEIIALSGEKPSQLQALLPTQADPRFVLWSIDRPDQELKERIRTRTEQMINAGLIAEFQKVQSCLPKCVDGSTRKGPLGSVGYQQVSDFLQSITPQGRKVQPGMPGLISEIELATRQLVKAQRTFLKGLKQKLPTARTFVLEKDAELLEDAFQELYQPHSCKN